MRSRIALSTSHIKRIICALPAVDSGRVVLDLDRFGVASLAVEQLHIGQDEVRLPLSFHPRGDPDARSVNVPLSLTNWQVRDEIIWFTLERAGVLRGALFRAAQGALHKLINGLVQRRFGDRVRLLRQDDQLGIPFTAFLEEWGSVPPSIEVAEMSKLVENSDRFVQIAFVEEVKMLCDEVGISIEDVRTAVNTKWNCDLLEARDGIGKECLPKDIRLLASIGKTPLLDGAIESDKKYKMRIKNEL